MLEMPAGWDVHGGMLQAPDVGPTETTGTLGDRTVRWDYPRLPEPNDAKNL